MDINELNKIEIENIEHEKSMITQLNDFDDHWNRETRMATLYSLVGRQGVFASIRFSIRNENCNPMRASL